MEFYEAGVSKSIGGEAILINGETYLFPPEVKFTMHGDL
jgi:hypothetical protein